LEGETTGIEAMYGEGIFLVMRRRGFTAVAEAAVLDLPSIDHVIADDLGSNDVGGHGSDIKTPRIDFIARESAF
jgi:hypothetical protein